MLHHIALKNFKCFEELRINLKNLTLITGINGAGKSSIVQALLLLRQSNDDKKVDLHKQVKIDGDLVDLIHADAMRYIFSKSSDIEINLTNDKTTIDFVIKDAVKETKEATCIPSENLDEFLETCSLFDENFVYLYAERTPPQRSYRKYSESATDSRLGDKHGNLTAYRFYQAMSGNENIQIPALKLSKENDTVIGNTSAWINQIMNSSIKISANEESTDQISINYVTNIHGDELISSPLNVAFGNSYILPIVLAILTAPVGSLIIIENPEAHLHPSAQFRMGNFLALAAQCGIQLIIETHSDHLLNGVRVMAKKKVIDADKVEIHYISQDEEDPRIHQDERILLEEDGSLSHWPNGFFDEWELALREINK